MIHVSSRLKISQYVREVVPQPTYRIGQNDRTSSLQTDRLLQTMKFTFTRKSTDLLPNTQAFVRALLIALEPYYLPYSTFVLLHCKY